MRGALEHPRQRWPPPVLSATALRRAVRRTRPDVVVTACTGPVVDVLINDVLAGSSTRARSSSPACPGVCSSHGESVAIPRPVDLFIVHSHREAAEFRELGEQLGVTGEVGLATLPFLPHNPAPALPAPAAPREAPRNRVVFATQAKVPVEREEREAILRALADLAARRPTWKSSSNCGPAATNSRPTGNATTTKPCGRTWWRPGKCPPTRSRSRTGRCGNSSRTPSVSSRSAPRPRSKRSPTTCRC